MGAIYGHGGRLDLRTVTICTNFQPPFNIKFHMKFEDIWPRGFREVIQRCEWMDRLTTDGVYHNSSSSAKGSGELKIHISHSMRKYTLSHMQSVMIQINLCDLCSLI